MRFMYYVKNVKLTDTIRAMLNRQVARLGRLLPRRSGEPVIDIELGRDGRPTKTDAYTFKSEIDLPRETIRVTARGRSLTEAMRDGFQTLTERLSSRRKSGRQG